MSNGSLGRVSEDLVDAVHMKWDDGRETPIAGWRVIYLHLAYAVTVHKLQGPQTEQVIALAEPLHLLDRSLIENDPPAGFAVCSHPGLSRDRKKEVESAKNKVALDSTPELLKIDLALTFESPWLIRDPKQAWRKEEHRRRNLPEAAKPIDAVPIRDENGKAFVPAKSLRGALRSRAEMILRTIGYVVPEPSKQPVISTKAKPAEHATKEIRDICDPAAKLFGLSGWLAPLRVSRFKAAADVTEKPQEFVAIDRFTGGAGEKLKFNAALAEVTPVKGKLTIDLKRLARVDPDSVSIGLLALVLRDLAQGDIPIGSGSAKGQGLCAATASVQYKGAPYHSLQKWFADCQEVKDGLAALRTAARQPPSAT